jgi:restriction system protein
MSQPKRNPISTLFMGAAATAAATLKHPWARPWTLLRSPRKPASMAATTAVVRSKLDTRQWSPELLKQLEWRRFEELCAAYYEAIGYRTQIKHTTAAGGVDIHLLESNAPSASMIVHCKAWDAYRVGVKAVRELRAALGAAKVGEGVLVTSGRFTQEAATLAPKEGIQLVDGAAFLVKLAALPAEKALALLKFATQGDFVTPTCPNCSVKMISRQSTREGRKFWGCKNYPRCKHTFSGTAHAPA